MRGLYDFDQTIIRMVPKWIALAMDVPALRVKILAKFPNYEDIKDDIDFHIEQYGMNEALGFTEAEGKAFANVLDECGDFYEEFMDAKIPGFGIANVEETMVVSQSDGVTPASHSKAWLLEQWKKSGKINDWIYTNNISHDKVKVIEQRFSDYDFLVEDNPKYVIQVCKRLKDMKVHVVPYKYNADSRKYLEMAYPDRLI